MSLFKAMLATIVRPDVIVVDSTEGGTAAAPLELTGHVGMPPIDGLSFAHNAIVGAGLRDRIRLGAFGRIFSGFNKAWQIATAESFQHAPPAS